ncbi:MAG: DEAD/DEAH box helicase family protein, partial [Sciscionella sp.]
MSDPYQIPTERPDSAAPLVPLIREQVDAWRRGGYRGASETSVRLLEHWFLDEHQTRDGAPFQYYFCQREAIETIIYLYEVARRRTLGELIAEYATRQVAAEGQQYPRYVVKAATGSGKTKVMSLLLAWSYFHRLREPDSELTTDSLVVAPNLIVFERLRTDFEAGRIFRTDPVIPPEWQADFELAVTLRDEPIPRAAPGVLTLTNIQALYERLVPAPTNPVDALLGPKPTARPDQLPPLLHRVAERGRLLVINDEAHHLHDSIERETGEALTIWQTLRRLHERSGDGIVAQLDFSATPKNQQGNLFADIVSDYPLAQAIDDGIVKRPVIGELSGQLEATSDDAAVRYRRQLGAGVAKWREFREAFEPTGRKPLLFVMAENTEAADQIARYLETLHDLNGRVLTIHVNMGGRNRGEVRRSELAQARQWAREIDSDNNPYAAVVSVLMLREGWDVRNVSVIVPVRPLTAKSKILPEQTLGRGLRRMTPPGSGADEQVVIIEHEAFRDLWDTVIEAEGLDLKRRAAEDVRPEVELVQVDADRLTYDIEIPQLSRVLSRDTSALGRLRPADVPARALPLAGELRSEEVDYTGRDLRTGEVVDRASYPLPVADQPEPVLAWFVGELSRDTRVTGQFHVLAPLVRGYIENRTFGGPVDMGDPLVLQALREPAAQEAILAALRQTIDEYALVSSTPVTEPKPILLSATRPFVWSRETARPRKSIFTVQPCDNGLEVRFCEFLDRCPDVAAFAKLAREVRFSMEYRTDAGRLAYYYPDFVVRLGTGNCMVIETKGRTDPDVPHKDNRANRWAVDATVASGIRWSYVRVDEELFDRYAASLGELQQLVDLVYETRRQEYLRSLPPPRSRSREEALALMDRIREKMRGVTGIDEELR